MVNYVNFDIYRQLTESKINRSIQRCESILIEFLITTGWYQFLGGSSVTMRRVRTACHPVQLGNVEFDVYGIMSAAHLQRLFCSTSTAVPENRN